MWDGPFRLWQVRCILTEPERFFAYILIIIYSDGLAHFGPERYQFCAPEDVHNSISQKRWDGPVWFLGAQISQWKKATNTTREKKHKYTSKQTKNTSAKTPHKYSSGKMPQIQPMKKNHKYASKQKKKHIHPQKPPSSHKYSSGKHTIRDGESPAIE